MEITCQSCDPSSSQSERWELRLVNDQTGEEIRVCNLYYGTVADMVIPLVKGRSYTYRLFHAGTNRPEGPDYDWLLLFNDTDAAGPRLPLLAGTGIFPANPC